MSDPLRDALLEIQGLCQEVAHEVEDPTQAVSEIEQRVRKALAVRPSEGGEEGLRERLAEFDAWLSFRPEFSEVLTAYRSAFGTDTSATTQKPQDEECERCKDTGHDWEPGPTGEPVSTGPCPDCQPQDEEER